MGISIPVVFIKPSEGAIGGPPASEEWFKSIEEKVLGKLKELYPHIKFNVYEIRDSIDVSEFLEKESGAIGYVVFILNCISGLARPIIQRGKPVILIAETYGGSGDYVLEYPRALAEEYPVIGIATRDISDYKVLSKIKYLEVIYRLKKSKIVFILSPSERRLASLEYPLSIDIYSVFKTVQASIGLTPIVVDVGVFKEKYYDKVDLAEAKRVAEKWIAQAENVVDTSSGDIEKSARLYLALKMIAKDYGANAVAIDCIVLYQEGFLDAWPCLGFTELWYDNIVPVCEADLYSAVLLLMAKYLVDANGFIVDPAVDELKNEIIYYHCYAPLTLYGSAKTRHSYIITSAHLGLKKASVHVKLPKDTEITVLGFSPDEKIMTIHTAKVVNIEYSNYACSNKIVGKINVSSIVRKWPWRTGWHRIVIYGNHRNEFMELARLLKLKVIEEDRF